MAAELFIQYDSNLVSNHSDTILNAFDYHPYLKHRAQDNSKILDIFTDFQPVTHMTKTTSIHTAIHEKLITSVP